MPSGISVADLFAALDLDSTGFDSKLAAAKVGLVTAAQDMALPIGNINQLLKTLSKELGPTVAKEGMVQLTAAGKTAEESVRSLLTTITQLKQVEAESAAAAKQWASDRDAAGREDSARADHALAQKKAVNDEIAKFEADLASAEKAQIVAREADEKALNDSVVAFYRQQTDAAKAASQARQNDIAQLRQNATALTQLGIGIIAAFAPLDAVVFGSSKAFADFDAELTHSLSIMGNVSDSLRNQISAAAVELSQKFAFSAKDIAKAVYDIGSAGYNAEQSLSILPVVTKFAAAAFTDLETATKLLTSSQAAMGLRTDDAATSLANMTRIGDVLVKADTLAAGTSKQFAEALYNVGSTARQLKVPLETTVAALAVFARQGITGAEAGTQLGIVLRDLSQKAITHADAWKKLNVDVYDSAGNFNNLGSIIKQLNDHFEGLSAEQVRYDLIQSGVQQRSMRFILTMLGMGDAIGQFETTLKGAAGTMDTIAGKNLDTFNKQLELLKNSVTALGIEIGGSLVGELNKLIGAGGPVSTLVQSLTQGLHDMDPAVKAIGADLALVGVAGGAATGAFALVAGQALRMAADIKTLGGSIESMNALLGIAGMGGGAAVGLIGLMGISLVAAIVAATKQWDDYKGHLDEVYQKQKAFYDLKPKLPDNPTNSPQTPWVPAAGFSAADGAQVGQGYAGLKVIIEGVTGAQAKLGATTKEWSVAEQQALDNAQKRFQANKFNLDAIDKDFAAVKEAFAAGIIDQATYNADYVGYVKARKAALAEETSSTKAAFAEQNAEFKEQAAAVNEAVKTQERYTKELKTFGVEIQENKVRAWTDAITDLKKGVDDNKVSQESYNTALAKFHDLISFSKEDMDKIAAAAVVLDAQVKKATDKKNWDDMRNGIGPVGEAMALLAKASVATAQGQLSARNETIEVTRAFKELGLKSSGQLADFAKNATADFEIIRASGTAAPNDINRAWVKVAEAQMDAGKKFSAAQMFIIAEVEEASKSASNRVLDLARSVSRELTHLVDSMAQTFVTGLASLFDNSANNKINDQIKQLTADADAHTAAFKQAQVDASNAIIQINDDLAKSLADINAKSQKALADETSSYNKFVSDTNAKIQSVVTTHQAAMAKEVQAVQAGLRKAEDEYQSFVNDAADKLQQLVRAHSDAQRQIREDASKSLRDQTTDYSRFVEDTNDAIRKAQIAGDAQQVADLQKSLQRRTEDYNTFRSDLAQKEAEDLAANQAQQAQEVADLNKSIVAKKKALDDAQAAAAQQIADITKQHADAQAQELKDLEVSLQERTAAYDQFKLQNASDLAAAVKDAQDKAAAAVQATKDQLAQQKAAYDAYMADYKAKLADLEAQHKSVFDKIADMFKSMLQGFAQELGKFVASTIFKGLLTSLRDKLVSTFDLGGLIPGTNKSPVQVPTDIPPGGNVDLSKLPGSTPSTPSTPSTGSGGSGGLGPLSGGALSAIGIGVDIAAGITQGIQMARLINLTGEMEVTSRGELNQLISIQGTLNTYFPNILHLVDIWAAILVTNDILRLIGQFGGGGGGSDSGDPTSLAQQIADAINNSPTNRSDSTLADINAQNYASENATQAYNNSIPVTQANTTATYDLSRSVGSVVQQIQGLFPQGPDTSLPDGRVQPDVYGVTSQSPGASRTDQLFLGSDIERERQRQIQNLAPTAPAGAFMQGAPIGTQYTGFGNGGLANGNGEGRTGFDTLSSTFQYTNYARPMSSQTPGQNLNVTINVPNPDGDLVAAGFIDSVEKRGVRLR